MAPAGRAATTAGWPAGTVPFLLALPVLAGGAMLPPPAGWVLAVVVVVVLGVPHGALDVEIGRTLLRSRFPRLWFPVFGLPYLAVVAAVLLAWQLAPAAVLAGFLLLSAWHFGTEEAGAPGLDALVRGGLPIAVPVLAQPGGTARVLSAASGLAMDAPPAWLVVASLLWLLALGVWLTRVRLREAALPAVLCAGFAVVPPLTAFALYFVAVHAPAHVSTLLSRHPGRVPRVRGAWAAWWCALPTTLLTVAIGAALWPLFPGPAPVRLVCLALQLLAAFTVPHVLLDAWLDRRDARSRGNAAPAHRPVAIAGLRGARLTCRNPEEGSMTVAAILRHKGSEVASVAPNAPISEVIHLLAERHIGAVLVMDGPRLAGILSERDLVRCLARHGASALDLTAETLMTRQVHTASREMTSGEAMAAMTEGRFRHLPVVEEGRVAGIISIGDVVKHRLDQQAQEVDQLKAYVAGS